MPKKVEKYPWLRVTKDITEILFRIAVSAGGNNCCILDIMVSEKNDDLIANDFQITYVKNTIYCVLYNIADTISVFSYKKLFSFTEI